MVYFIKVVLEKYVLLVDVVVGVVLVVGVVVFKFVLEDLVWWMKFGLVFVDVVID